MYRGALGADDGAVLLVRMASALFTPLPLN